MSFWSEHDWREANEKLPVGEEIVSNFDDSKLKDGCYRMSIGSEAMLTIDIESKDSAKRKLAQNDDFEIKPGQFAHLLTEETVQIPKNAIGLINISTNEKIKGLVNVSGFHVDPAYSGRLIFTVFNAGGSNISLQQGQTMFRLWLLDYRGSASNDSTTFNEIPRDWGDRLKGAYPSPFMLSKRVNALENDVVRILAVKTRNTIIYGFVGLFTLTIAATMSATFATDFISERVIPSFAQIYQAARNEFGAAPSPTTETPSPAQQKIESPNMTDENFQ